VPTDWPDGVRHGGDVSLICGIRVEREKARLDTATERWREGAFLAAATVGD